MLLHVILAWSTVIAAPPKQLASLKLDIVTVPEREMMEQDVVFLRVTIKNVGKEPVVVRAWEDPEQGHFFFYLSGAGNGGTQTFPDNIGTAAKEGPPYVALGPGASRTVYYLGDGGEVLRVPPPWAIHPNDQPRGESRECGSGEPRGRDPHFRRSCTRIPMFGGPLRNVTNLRTLSNPPTACRNCVRSPR